jgi:endonuclease YncB( thermonuclease family)
MKSLLRGETHGKDRDHHMLATVHRDGVNVNHVLVKEGLVLVV